MIFFSTFGHRLFSASGATHTMSSSNERSNGTVKNSTITLKSFAELANVIDLDTLPPGPSDNRVDAYSALTDRTHTDSVSGPGVSNESLPPSNPTLDLADVIAQLAQVSSDLENMARTDARAREQATIELAQYETLAAERHQAERARASARGVRATAELLISEAFTEQARADAARHAAVARAAELTCTQLLAERVRAADELASRPHLARVLTERRQREREEVEAVQWQAQHLQTAPVEVIMGFKIRGIDKHATRLHRNRQRHLKPPSANQRHEQDG